MAAFTTTSPGVPDRFDEVALDALVRHPGRLRRLQRLTVDDRGDALTALWLAGRVGCCERDVFHAGAQQLVHWLQADRRRGERRGAAERLRAGDRTLHRSTDPAERAVEDDALDGLIARLPARLRPVARLLACEDLTVVEACARCGVSPRSWFYAVAAIRADHTVVGAEGAAA